MGPLGGEEGFALIKSPYKRGHRELASEGTVRRI
jgi:hypothetical protein